ncbi:hypothetical protein [Simiduia aestuariiviva]|uniref:Uncharacterized protein n=1 Tax=Simiduia aestuariiviva TaxID=1510459 RepID=A0A839UKE5_9GAMM|nr:hypothetical protein [Simiduia aestuariiviva]MBB3167080.1 hypothetical protein [Simiduia aestuariiviva]
MRNLFFLLILVLFSATTKASDPMAICLITGLPASDVSYEKIQRIKLGKGSYGSVADILPAFAQKADTLGANAIVNYVGSQRFGFWPWRVVRPVVRGEAVKLDIASDKTCKDIGGATVQEVIDTNMEPHLLDEEKAPKGSS